MSFIYIDWIKDHYTKKQRAEINMAENEFNRACELVNFLFPEDKDLITRFIIDGGLSDKGRKLKHEIFEETNKKFSKKWIG